MIIDCKNLILGRVAAYAAKKALLGETVDLINVDGLIISGNKRDIIRKYQHRASLGGPFHGPFWPKISSLLVKRIIRGMLPHKQFKGKSALKRIKCYKGIPRQFENKKLETLKNANISKLKNLKYMTIAELSKELKG